MVPKPFAVNNVKFGCHSAGVLLLSFHKSLLSTLLSVNAMKTNSPPLSLSLNIQTETFVQTNRNHKTHDIKI
jgi:hypothetical protein